MDKNTALGIAIIGLAGRFPQAATVEAFWELLKAGREAIVTFSEAELLAAGVDAALLQHPAYVKRGVVIPDLDRFDADFFAMSGRDAEIMDPQYRLFLECAWQALEQAGYPPTTTTACIGLYAGIGENDYERHYLEPKRAEVIATLGAYRLRMLNGKDFMATHTAYKLNLTGPVVMVQTACSTSLVAVHMACQSLLNFECDMALAGGVSLSLPQGHGYLYRPGMILSPDGHCRAFDAQAQGTVSGGGVGVVMLKRLDEAVADGDTIHAVIWGSAVNNDGANKIGYTAPSVSGQTRVILEAQAAAGVHPDEISYLEAHGTGTPLGDPIEIQALTQAFRTHTPRVGYCALGSVKTNIGHADTAAGIVGLIKTVLMLKHQQLPPNLHFTVANPQIDFAHSPFFVNDRLREWKSVDGAPRYAGVSSVGIGGTNAHLILGEAPPLEKSGPSRPLQLLTLSAKTATALDAATNNLAHWLQQPCVQTQIRQDDSELVADLVLADVAYTLNRCRQPFRYRRTLVCTHTADAFEQLTQLATLPITQTPEKTCSVAFLFPGQGTQYAHMTDNLYETEPLFRNALDQCAELLLPEWGQDLRQLLYGACAQTETRLQQTGFTQPALFAVEYALAKLWMAWGIQPSALLGHSIGEYVAACLSGVFSLADALALVTARGQLLQGLPPGAMLALPLSEREIQAWLTPELSLAVINGPERCVLSGAPAAIAAVQQKFQQQGIEGRTLHTSHAFHSHMMEPILATFAQQVRRVRLSPPTIPYLSNLTGGWISPAEATDPMYWVRHLRQTVRFGDNLQALFQQPIDLLLEVGPGQTLAALAQQHLCRPAQCKVFSSLPRQREMGNHAEVRQMLSTLGQLWANGAAMDWDGFYAAERRRHLPLPTYPFERNRYWLDSPTPAVQATLPVVQPLTAIDAIDKQNAVSRNGLPPATAKRSLSMLEQQVATIWSQSLGIATLEPDSDFFALGGDSLLATQVMARLRTHFQLTLDSHALLQTPTLARFTTYLATQLAQPATTHRLPELVVEIQRGNPAKPPLVLLHPVGGHVYFYRDLARHLAPDLPIYGIRALGVEGEAEPLTTMGEMAQIYSAALQALQPHGPYSLGGASFGGTLAYAIAQQLLAQGETVDFLALIDTPSQGNMPMELNENADILFYLLKMGTEYNIDRQTFTAMDETAQLDYFLSRRQETFTSRHELTTMLKLFNANLRAMRAYTPPTYPGKLHFFLARERDAFNAQTPAHGWIGLAEQGIEIYTVPGNHLSMNAEPHVQHLAKHLQQCLQRASQH